MLAERNVGESLLSENCTCIYLDSESISGYFCTHLEEICIWLSWEYFMVTEKANLVF